MEDVIIFSIFGQIFNEYAQNLKTVGSKDPFISEGNFRLNHLLTKNFHYKLNETTDLKAEVTFLTKNQLNIKYTIEEANGGKKIEDEISVEGKYTEETDNLNVECRLKGRVSS